MQKHFISSKKLNIQKAIQLIQQPTQLDLSEAAQQKITACALFLAQKIGNEPIYGINTGFGHLCNVAISNEEINELQRNLLISHACGMGEEVPAEIVKLMLFLKIQSLSYGHSGVQLTTVQRLMNFFNENVLPVVYQQGSLGASGDLVPLSHLALPLIGLGEVFYKNKKQSAKKVNKKRSWKPLNLQFKEGLALINGTQFMSAYGVFCVHKAVQLAKMADLIAAISIDAFDARPEPFEDLTHRIRGQKGQRKCAKRIRKFLKGSEILTQAKTVVQDPYSFRCIPQVHGASWDVMAHVKDIFEREINAVTDNPNIFPEEDRILSGGNFHGQPLALALDYLAMAVAELGNIAERRIYKLVGGERDLPTVLSEGAGLHSGLLIPQYVAASIVSQNKQLCTPASVDSITSSKGQEDHVSMGANAATKCYQVVNNLEKILAIELLTATQALHFRQQKTTLKSSPLIEKVIKAYRKTVPFLDKDRFLHVDMQRSVVFLQKELLVFLKK